LKRNPVVWAKLLHTLPPMKNAALAYCQLFALIIILLLMLSANMKLSLKQYSFVEVLNSKYLADYDIRFSADYDSIAVDTIAKYAHKAKSEKPINLSAIVDSSFIGMVQRSKISINYFHGDFDVDRLCFLADSLGYRNLKIVSMHRGYYEESKSNWKELTSTNKSRLSWYGILPDLSGIVVQLAAAKFYLRFPIDYNVGSLKDFWFLPLLSLVMFIPAAFYAPPKKYWYIHLYVILGLANLLLSLAFFHNLHLHDLLAKSIDLIKCIGYLVLLLPIILKVKRKARFTILLVLSLSSLILLFDGPNLNFVLFSLIIIFYAVNGDAINRTVYSTWAYSILTAFGSVILSIIFSINNLDAPEISQSISMFSLIGNEKGLFGILAATSLALFMGYIYIIYFRLNRLSIQLSDIIIKLLTTIAFAIPIYLIIGNLWFLISRAVAFGLADVLITWGSSIYLSKLFLSQFRGYSPANKYRSQTIMDFTSRSYEHLNTNEYESFFKDFVHQIEPELELCLCSGYDKFIVEFPEMTRADYETLLSICANRPAESYLNIDLDLLNDTDLGKVLGRFVELGMPRLCIPFYREDKIYALLLVSKQISSYWSEALASSFVAIVDVFRKFYFQILAQMELSESTSRLLLEQEAKEHSIELARLSMEKNKLLEEEQLKISQSISYASLLQKSMLPQETDLKRLFSAYDIIWLPRDVVGGDIYWSHELTESGEFLFAVIDCTGHGVPGAMISISAVSALNSFAPALDKSSLSDLLSELHQEIGATLHQKSANTQQDGFDIGIVKINKARHSISFCGASINLLIYEPEKGISQFKATRKSVGGLKWKEHIDFQQFDLNYSEGTTLYIYSDGLQDQSYLENGKIKRFSSQKTLDLMSEVAVLPIEQQSDIIRNKIRSMVNETEQRDDITVAILQL